MKPVRFSTLKYMRLSPAHYQTALVTERDSRPMRLGRATDAYVLGGPQPVVYEGARRGKAWEAFASEHEGKEILTADEHDVARRMADAVLDNRDATALLAGNRQQEIRWSYLGRDCVSHPDVLGPEYEFVSDLKTSNTSDPARFRWQALRMAYHAQLAFYVEAVRSSGLGKPDSAYLVAVESSAPYPVTVMRLTDRALEAGARLFRLWFERLLACEAAGEWPGYVQSVVELDIDEDPELVFGDDGLEAA